jgi:dATP pyrophosphohydrolase
MPTVVSRIVEVVVFRFSSRGPEYLLLQRSSGDELYPGIWQVVTGTLLEGETALAAARREVTEETGLAPDRLWIVPFVSAFYDHRSDEIHHCPFFAAQVGPGEPVLSPEHQRHAWLGFSEAAQRLLWPSQREGLAIAEQVVIRGEAAAAWLRVPLL